MRGNTSTISRRELRRRRVLTANSRIGLGTIAFSGALSFFIAGTISYLFLYQVPGWMRCIREHLWNHFESVTKKPPVIRNLLAVSGPNLTMSMITENYLSVRVPLVLSTSRLCPELIRVLESGKTRGTMTKITLDSATQVISISGFEALFSDLRRRSSNPSLILDESEFMWNSLVDDHKLEATLQNCMLKCAPNLMRQNEDKDIIESFDDASSRVGLTASLRNQGSNFKISSGFINLVVEGEQYWILIRSELVPANTGIHPSETVSRWIERSYPNVTTEFTPTEATLGAGEMLFVPEGYYFAFVTKSDISTSLVKFRKPEVGEAYQAYIEGKRRFDRRDYKGAEKLFRKALEKKDGYSHIILEDLGLTLAKMMDFEGAEEHYRRAIYRNKRSVVAYERLVRLQQERSNIAAAGATIKLAAKHNALSAELLKLNESISFLLL